MRTHRVFHRACSALRAGALIGAASLPSTALAQNIAARINSAPDGRVAFTFAARPGVCGNGRSYIQTGPNSFSGSWIGNFNETTRMDPCVAGPVRVVLDRADRMVLSIQTYVGPPNPSEGTTELGAVRAQDAA